MKTRKTLQKRHILYVDNNTEAQENFKRTFSNRYEVTTADSGLEALKWIEKSKRNRPDIVVSEILLPGMSGYHVLRAIHSRTGLLNTPFIFLSSSVSEYRIEEVEGEGEIEMFPKSSDLNEISVKIDFMLSLDFSVKEVEDEGKVEIFSKSSVLNEISAKVDSMLSLQETETSLFSLMLSD